MLNIGEVFEMEPEYLKRELKYYAPISRTSGLAVTADHRIIYYDHNGRVHTELGKADLETIASLRDAISKLGEKVFSETNTDNN